jgi:Na+/phosphate symporter
MSQIDLSPQELLDLESDSAELAVPLSPEQSSAKVTPAWWTRIRLDKIGLFGASIFLFGLAIMLMKEGAGDLTPLVINHLAVDNAFNSLGFGWLAAYLLMSGSPVAAAALTFLEAATIDRLDAFMMINGSRLGASFIVLFIGFIYVLRGRDPAKSLSMGLLSFAVTGTIHGVGIGLGIVMLEGKWLDSFHPQSEILLASLLGLIFDPFVRLAQEVLPRWGLFLGGLGIIMVSFNFFDRCLPQMAVKESQVGHISRLVYRPWVMFALGAAVTLISMSVSISLSILVPLSHRSFVRRENVIPYIMGANVTTFIDTLLAAMLLNNPAAFTIVLVEIVSITLVAGLILSTIYQPYQRAMLSFVGWVTANHWHLTIFMSGFLLVPLGLLLL